MRLLAFGLVVGAGVQAWRNFPPDGPYSANSAVLVMVFGMVAAFLAGYRWGRPSAHASASAYAAATADATSNATAANTVNLAVVVPGSAGATHQGASLHPSEAAPWLAQGASVVHELGVVEEDAEDSQVLDYDVDREESASN